jgi:hypothetical protein
VIQVKAIALVYLKKIEDFAYFCAILLILWRGCQHYFSDSLSVSLSVCPLSLKRMLTIF